MDNVYKMELLKQYIVDQNTLLTRVPGGWVYSDMQGCCFVPFNNDFQIDPPKSELVEIEKPAHNNERAEIFSKVICDYCVNHSGIKCDVDFPNCFSGKKLSPVS